MSYLIRNSDSWTRFESIIGEYTLFRGFKEQTDTLVDPGQFTYHANPSVNNVVALGHHYILQHLKSAGSYACVLFVDYSFEYKTILPSKLKSKLLEMDVNPHLCVSILDFLINRPQRVCFGFFSFRHRQTNKNKILQDFHINHEGYIVMLKENVSLIHTTVTAVSR